MADEGRLCHPLHTCRAAAFVVLCGSVLDAAPTGPSVLRVLLRLQDARVQRRQQWQRAPLLGGREILPGESGQEVAEDLAQVAKELDLMPPQC